MWEAVRWQSFKSSIKVLPKSCSEREAFLSTFAIGGLRLRSGWDLWAGLTLGMMTTLLTVSQHIKNPIRAIRASLSPYYSSEIATVPQFIWCLQQFHLLWARWLRGGSGWGAGRRACASRLHLARRRARLSPVYRRSFPIRGFVLKVKSTAHWLSQQNCCCLLKHPHLDLLSLAGLAFLLLHFYNPFIIWSCANSSFLYV